MSRLIPALCLAAVFGVAACSSAASSTAPSQTPRGGTSVPTPSAPIGWKTYAAADYGYSLSYPPTWLDAGSFGPADEHYFSNEQIGSPMQMSSAGIFVGVSANCQVKTGSPDTLINQTAMVVGGVPAVRYVELVSNIGGQAFLAVATVKPGTYCYRIFMEALSRATLEANLADFDRMLASVRFSARTAAVTTPRETTPPTR
jgi:hypothetical protein